MTSTIGTETLPIVLDQTQVLDTQTLFVQSSKAATVTMKPPPLPTATLSSLDYSKPTTRPRPIAKKIKGAMNELLDFSKRPVLKTSTEPLTVELLVSNFNGKSKVLPVDKNTVKTPRYVAFAPAKPINRSVIPSDLEHVLIAYPSGVQSGPYCIKANNTQVWGDPLKLTSAPAIHIKSADLKQDIECFKCHFCPFMTLDKSVLDLHHQRLGACCTDLRAIKCPGCDNIFYSNTPLKSHLASDHNMNLKEIKIVLQNLSHGPISLGYKADNTKSSCVFEPGEQVLLNGASTFSPTELDLTLPAHQVEERSSCINEKRTSMLESYLDDISNKNDCSIPPRLSQNGADLLENTFNFTAPVSEQLPPIQPENVTTSVVIEQTLLEEASHSPLEDSHLLDSSTRSHHHLIDSDNDGQRHFVVDSTVSSVESSSLQQEVEEETLIPQHITDGNQHYLTISDTYEHGGNSGFKREEQNGFPYMSNDIPTIHLEDKLGPHDFDFVTEEQPPTESQAPPLVENKIVVRKIGCGFRCDINGCKFRMQSDTNIAYHRRCHEGKIYNCPECCKDCPTWISLSSHLWQAHQIDMELYKCDLCPYRTPSYSRLTGIHRGIHGVSRPFLCDICGKGFKTSKQMRNHKNVHKAKMVRMAGCFCNICGRTVADKRLLERHINHKHKKEKPFLCSICGYSTALKHSLVVHIRKHTGEKPHKCDKCPYRSADHNALRRHRMKHTGDRIYKCTQCSYSCIQAHTFKAHIKYKHPGLEARLIFSCSHCPFQTIQRGAYLSHTAEHQNKISDFYPEAVELGPIISERVVETIVDLSGAQSLLQEDYYEVERIEDHLDHSVESSMKHGS